MTRFARAKGSKSSNERAPEDSTPWEVMKEQLLHAKKEGDESKKRQEAEQQRIDNYENFLKERKVQKRNATWCDFPEVSKSNTKSENHLSNQPKKKKKKKEAKPEELDTNHTDDGVDLHPSKSEEKAKKHKNKKNKPQVVSEVQNQEATPGEENAEVNKKQKNKKKSRNQNKTLSNPPQTNDNQVSNKELNNNPPKTDKPEKKKRKTKIIDGKPVRRKEINDRSFQLIINGKEVELVRFDGFPIMKKDADRLSELKGSMMKKGIPKSEVQRTMKLERRRAEKALARLKRDVCYNCRKGGHVLSDCPELKSKIPNTDAAEGVCFKCGSTEHRQFECKVQREKEFRFATCFICKEPGHIARQCPDNPKGLYPNGGNCKLCGDVTHLRKDCPTVSDKKEVSSYKLQTLASSDNIEDVGQPTSKVTTAEPSKKPKKIKF